MTSDDSPAPRLGIVAGMEAELAALGRWRDDPRIATAVSGARPEQAEERAARLVASGCRALLSWGLAGGLDPLLRPGDLVSGETVVTLDGETQPLAPVPAGRGVRLLGLDRMATEISEKAKLHAATGAAALDMETHRIAAVAARAGLPVFAIRAVADPAGRALPGLVRTAIDPEGRPRIGAVIAGLVARPGALPALLRLRADSDAGLAALRRAAAEGAIEAVLGRFV